MIRDAEQADVDAIVDMAVEAHMFEPDDRRFLASALTESLTEHRDEHRLIVDADADGLLLAAAYCQPKTATDRAWDLTMIVVRPSLQRGGLGGILLEHVEQDLHARGQRMLLVETSSTGQFDGARAFYRRHGYDEEAVVRDYWTDGDDLVLFRKRL